MRDIIQKTLNKIQKESIVPEARWKFLARKFGKLSLALMIVFLSGVSLSMLWYLLFQLDWDFPLLNSSFFVYVLKVFPYFWLFFLLTFIFGAFFFLRKTEKGYRLEWAQILFAIFVGMFLGGLFFSIIGLDRHFNSFMMQGIPFYAHTIETKEKQWSQPENGLLAGTIQEIDGGQIILKDFNGISWKILIDQETFIRSAVSLKIGEAIKIIGRKNKEEIFQANEIRPWMGNGRMKTF